MAGDDLCWGRREHVDAGGVRVHVEAAGPETARPVLACLHGFASGTFTWAGLAAELVGDHRPAAAMRTRTGSAPSSRGPVSWWTASPGPSPWC